MVQKNSARKRSSSLKVGHHKLCALAGKIKRPLGLAILFTSTFVLFNEILYPAFNTRAEAKVLLPVPDNYFEEMALKRLAAFSFAELAFNELIDPYADLAPGETIPPVFYLTVPELGLSGVAVETNSVDTTPHEMLGHYKGSSLPGKRGNVFVYGHSTLPSHFDINNYKTLFTFLPKLEAGDEIIVNYNNKDYIYVVEKKEVFEPDELDPLKWRHLHYGSLSLMTCTPPGTTNQRTVVFAKQVY